MSDIFPNVDFFNFPRTVCKNCGDTVATIDMVAMPPLTEIKSGAFTLEFKRELPQDEVYAHI